MSDDPTEDFVEPPLEFGSASEANTSPEVDLVSDVVQTGAVASTENPVAAVIQAVRTVGDAWESYCEWQREKERTEQVRAVTSAWRKKFEAHVKEAQEKTRQIEAQVELQREGLQLEREEFEFARECIRNLGEQLEGSQKALEEAVDDDVDQEKVRQLREVVDNSLQAYVAATSNLF
jgi:hypothetical protein